MTVKKINVADFLRSVTGGQMIDWVLNPGNAGDSLIVAGTVQLLGDNGILYRCITDYDTYDSAGKIMCYSGGGNLVPYYRFARDFIERQHQRAARLILLPHTIDGHEDLLAKLGTNVTLICREEVSYEFCRRIATKAEVYAADDLAFSLDPKMFLNRGKSFLMLRDQNTELKLGRRYREFVARMVEKQLLRDNLRNFFTRARRKKTLAVWREDVESSDRRPDAPNCDISNIFGIESIYGLAAMLTSAEYFLRAVDQFDLIRTDRLHVATAAALLGKEVELYPNSYYKNRAIYDFSLKEFPRVHFVDWL